MTDKRMEYMQDALGYIEDSYIEEAAEALGHARRKKEKKRRIRVRILQAAAMVVLCWCILEALASGPNMLMKWKGKGDEMAPTKAGIIVDGNAKPNQQPTAAGKPIYEEFIYDPEDQVGQVVTTPSGEIPDGSDANGSASDLTAEEIFAQDIAIFRGTVDDMDYYKGTGVAETYFAVLYVGVSECYQGELEEGDVCRIFIPLIPGYSTNSLAGNLDQLSLGSEAIFMPNISGPEDRYDLEEGSLVYEELADYYFTDGQHYLFLEKNGKMFYDDIYGITPAGSTVVMDDVASYVKEKIKK